MIIEAEAPLSKTTDSDGARSATLTKINLIEEVSRVVEISRKEAAVIVERILDSMVHAIDHGDKVEIRGFGSFRTRQRRARIGRNPKTGARVEVPAKRIPFFNPARNFANWLRKSKTRKRGLAELGQQQHEHRLALVRKFCAKRQIDPTVLPFFSEAWPDCTDLDRFYGGRALRRTNA